MVNNPEAIQINKQVTIVKVGQHRCKSRHRCKKKIAVYEKYADGFSSYVTQNQNFIFVPPAHGRTRLYKSKITPIA